MSRSQRAASTRAALVATARQQFARDGFAATPIEDVFAGAGVSRGALYHHFASKEDLFLAVYEAVEADVADRVLAAAARGRDPLDGLRRGLDAFLGVCLDAEVQRIVLLDGPGVLGWEKWHEVDERYGFGITRAGLEMAMDAGQIERGDPEPLAHALLGALIQAGMVVARAPNPRRAKREMAATLNRLLDGLTTPQ